MARKIAYWITTVIVAGLSLLAARSYLSGNAHDAFARLGYPQQLRIILGIAKPLGAIILVIPGVPRLKEWAYAGFTFAWTCAFVAHYLVKDFPTAFMPLALLVILAVSYWTRPAGRAWPANTLYSRKAHDEVQTSKAV
jgi:DoxX-like family